MTTFFMFGAYTRDSVKGIASKRTEKAEAIVEGYGGRLRSVYALLGLHDLVLIVELPGVQEAVQVSVDLTRETGTAFSSAPAIPVADFDRLLGEN